MYWIVVGYFLFTVSKLYTAYTYVSALLIRICGTNMCVHEHCGSYLITERDPPTQQDKKNNFSGDKVPTSMHYILLKLFSNALEI